MNRSLPCRVLFSLLVFKVVVFEVVLGGQFLCALDLRADSRIDEIQRQVEDETRKLAAIDRAKEALEKELAAVRAPLAVLRIQERKLTDELGEITAERGQAEKEMRHAMEELKRVSELSLKRVRAVYMQQDKDVSGWLLFLGSLSDLSVDVERNSFYLTKIRERDARISKQLEQLRGEKEKKEIELRNLSESQELYRNKISERRAEVSSRVAQQEALVHQLKAQKSEKEATLISLKAQALRLETVVTSLTGGSLTGGKEGHRLTGATGKPEVVQSSSTAPLPPYRGTGLSKLKGTLESPIVDGRVVRRFGETKSSGFKEIVLSRGVEISAAVRSPVRAIAPGMVIFNGAMPGYGKILILDHGERYYSLYGLLAETKVTRGEVLQRGQVVGLSGDLIDEDKNFYFEIRKNGEPVNPRAFYPGRTLF